MIWAADAMQSVDAQMVCEMNMGEWGFTIGECYGDELYDNTGGPYGLEVLEGVQTNVINNICWVYDKVTMEWKGGDGNDW